MSLGPILLDYTNPRPEKPATMDEVLARYRSGAAVSKADPNLRPVATLDVLASIPPLWLATTELLAGLNQFGVQTPYIEAYKALSLVTEETPQSPTPPADLLGMSPQQLREYAMRGGAWSAAVETRTSTSYRGRMEALRDPLKVALMDAIRADADGILDQLRPTFDTAADVMRQARAAGVEPDSTHETLFNATDEARRLFTASEDAAATLEELFRLRQQLSLYAGIQPTIPERDRARFSGSRLGEVVDSGINWAVTVTDNASLPAIGEYDSRGRWLIAADHLRLMPIPHLTDFEQLQEQRPDIAAALTLEALKRTAAH